MARISSAVPLASQHLGRESMLSALTCIRSIYNYNAVCPKKIKLTRYNLGTLVPVDHASLLPYLVQIVLPGSVGSEPLF